MNFVQQKSAILNKNLPRNAKVPERNATTSSSSEPGPAGMLERFYSESSTRLPQMLPPEPKKTKKGFKVLGSAQSFALNSDSNEPHVILVITEGRNNATGEIGMAAVDMNSPTLILSQFSDDLWYTGTVIKIQMLEPSEIIVPNTVYSEDNLVRNSNLIRVILNAFPNIKIKPTLRKFFNDVDAMTMIGELCSPHCQNVKLALEGKYYALTAAGGLFRYLQTVTYVVFAPESLKIVYEAKYGAMMIDVETSKRLELVASLMPRKNKNSCLYQCLDRCQTNIGKRSLRARILAPLCDMKQIREFQEAVQELIDNQALLCTLKSILKKFRTVDKMQRLCIIIPQNDAIRAAEMMINHVITVKSCLEALPQLNDILATLTHKTFSTMRQALEDPRYSGILTQIGEFISDSIQLESGQKQFIQRIHAVKEDINVFLDISRRLYYCLVDDVKKLVTSISQKYDLSLQLAHNCTKGYHMVLTVDPKKPPPEIPEEFEVLMRRGSKILLRNEELVDLDSRIRSAVNEILIISNQIIDKLLQNIRKDIDCFYMLSGVIVEIDLIQNFASLGSIDGTVCPKFGTDLQITDGLHPFLEFGQSHVIPVPNNVLATSDYNFFIITGPNMGGKTVYIKMVAILQIMAQIGAYVPAVEASFRICDKLFSRMGFEDTVQRGVSNFRHEVQQSEYIQRNITPNSLVIVDELGRSTNPHEGKIWAWAMCEELSGLLGIPNDGMYFKEDTEGTTNGLNGAEEMKKLANITSPFIFLTTHFKELTKLPDYHFNIVNLYLDAEEVATERGIVLNYTHKIKFGVTPLKAYGLALARHVRFTPFVVPRAEEVFKRLENVSQNAEIEQIEPQNTRRREAVENLRKLYDIFSNLATIIFRPNPKERSKDAVRKEVMKIVKKFIDGAEPRFLMDMRTKTPSRVLNVSTSTVSRTSVQPVQQNRQQSSLNLETIRKDLQSEKTVTTISSEFHENLNNDQLRRTYTITTPTPPEEIPRSGEKIEQQSGRKTSSLVNFNLRAPYRPSKSKENLWELISSKQSPDSTTKTPSVSSFRMTSSTSVNHNGFDLFERDRKSSADFFFNAPSAPPTPGPSRKRTAVEDVTEDDEIQTEYDKMFLTQLTSTQDNLFLKDSISGEFNDLVGEPEKTSHDLEWESCFEQNTQQNVSKSREKSNETTESSRRTTKTYIVPKRREISKSSSGDFTEISSITPIEKPPLNFMDKYRENVISRLQDRGPLMPIRPVAKAQKKSLITKIPQINYKQRWEQRLREMERISVIAKQVIAESSKKESEKESENPTEPEETTNDSSRTQMSVCSAKIPWFPEIGTLPGSSQGPNVQPRKEMPKNVAPKRLVLDLAQLHKCQNSKL